MTALTDIASIALTSTALKAGHKSGTNLAALLINAQTKTMELQKLLTLIETLHPSTGGDATNYAELQTIISELT